MASRYAIGPGDDLCKRIYEVDGLFLDLCSSYLSARTRWRDHIKIREARVWIARDVARDCQTNACYSYKLAALKLVTPSKEHLEKHYEDLADKPFYKGLVTCM